GTIRISATVKGNNSGVLNFLDDAKELEIFRMKFMITNDRTFEGRTYPVHFVWNECWDNTISVDLPETGPGNETLYADSVLFENSQLVRQIELPATANFSESCFSGDNRSQKRVIDFHHGYINLCCYHMEDFSGDINLNGISNEVSDLLLFQDYFLDGISVFTVNPAGQIANTDVNYDNLTLKLEDLVHLNAIVKGDAIPFKKTQPLINGTMINDTNLNRVYMKADSAVYAVWIQLDGNVVLEPRIWSELFRFNHVDSVTDVLLFGINANSQSKIPLFQYKTKTTIKNAQAATRNGNRIDLTFDQ
ncbi:MAG TPA: hypothetical protein VHP63_03445, partial [candidate division Zixibacteria bacterium]|nr:hypothetical protein [candidate division Zixibacteria bacterium]